MNGPRVVVTGLGMVTPFACGREASWSAIQSGQRAARRVRLPLPRHAGSPLIEQEGSEAHFECFGAPAVWPENSGPRKNTLEPTVQFARFAAAEAWANAFRSKSSLRIDRERLGCVIGTSKGGLASAERFFEDAEGPDNSLYFPQMFPHGAATSVAASFDVRGPVLCPVAACATGLISLLRGVDLIREGVCDLVIAGSSDASLVPAVAASFQRLGVLAKSDDPASACRPYDQTRTGFVIGEGSGILILERLEHALAREAEIHGEWLGGGYVGDAIGLTHLDPDAGGLEHLVRETLRRADRSPTEIDYVNLHGTGTRENDVCETRGLKRAFGADAARLRCSSLKGSLGHLLGAAGSVELICTLLALRDGVIPPTANLKNADPACDLDYTPIHPRHATIKTALKLSLGFGGHLAAAVVGRLHDVRSSRKSGRSG